MPVYEFECKDCGQAVELLIRSSDKKKPRCKCGSTKLKKGFSAPAIVTKGKQSRAEAKASTTSCSSRGCGSCGCH